MKTYTITTEGLEPKNTLNAFKITYPAGHYMGNHLTPTTIVSSHPHKNTTYQGVEVEPDMDNAVKCEPITVQYPDCVDGYMGEARFVIPDQKRVMGILTGMFARGEAQ